MKRSKKFLIICSCTVILSNISPIGAIINFFVGERHYQYSNYNGSLTFSEFMSRDFEMMKRRHKFCLLNMPNLKDKQIYRIFAKNPLTFWRWRLYFFDERYKLPYKNWEEIKIRREKEKIRGVKGCLVEF